jgi:hypothetical protein
MLTSTSSGPPQVRWAAGRLQQARHLRTADQLAAAGRRNAALIQGQEATWQPHSTMERLGARQVVYKAVLWENAHQPPRCGFPVGLPPARTSCRLSSRPPAIPPTAGLKGYYNGAAGAERGALSGDVMRGCMAEKGYVLVRKDEVTAKAAAFAAASAEQARREAAVKEPSSSARRVASTR